MGGWYTRCNGSTGKLGSQDGVALPKTSPSGGGGAGEESVPQERAGQERSGAPGWKTFKLLLKGYHVHRWGFYKDEK